MRGIVLQQLDLFETIEIQVAMLEQLELFVILRQLHLEITFAGGERLKRA
jgi:hypothetical protein